MKSATSKFRDVISLPTLLDASTLTLYLPVSKYKCDTFAPAKTMHDYIVHVRVCLIILLTQCSYVLILNSALTVIRISSSIIQIPRKCHICALTDTCKHVDGRSQSQFPSPVMQTLDRFSCTLSYDWKGWSSFVELLTVGLGHWDPMERPPRERVARQTHCSLCCAPSLARWTHPLKPETIKKH